MLLTIDKTQTLEKFVIEKIQVLERLPADKIQALEISTNENKKNTQTETVEFWAEPTT